MKNAAWITADFRRRAAGEFAELLGIQECVVNALGTRLKDDFLLYRIGHKVPLRMTGKFVRRRKAAFHRTDSRFDALADRAQFDGATKDDQHNLLMMLSNTASLTMSGHGALTSPRIGGSLALPAIPSLGDTSQNRS